MDWSKQRNFPRADYLSSSRKRLLPQLLYKGAILDAWGKKQAEALHESFFQRLPNLPEVDRDEAEVAWLLYDLDRDESQNRFRLSSTRTVYTKYAPALEKISTPVVGRVEDFVAKLQEKLDDKLEGNAPDTRTLFEDPLTP